MPDVSLKYILVGEDRSASKSIQGVSKEAENFGTKLGGMVGRLGSTLGGEVGEIVDKVGGAFDAASASHDKIQKRMMATGGVATAAGVAITAMASKDVEAQNQLQAAVDATGKGYADFGDDVDSLVQKQVAFGHTDGEVKDSLRVLTQAYGDPKKALEEMGITTDLAAAKHISLSDAAGMVAKAHGGAGRVFKEFGITVGKTADGAKDYDGALAALSGKLSGQASAAQDSFGGKVREGKAWLDNATSAIGEQYGPALTTAGVAVTAFAALADSSAVKTGASWVASGVKTVGSFVATAASATVNGAVTAAQWVASGVTAAAAWAANAARAVGSFVVTAAGAVANAAAAAAAWVASAAVASAAWVASAATTAATWVASAARTVASFAVTAAGAVANGAITAAAWAASAAESAAAWVASSARTVGALALQGIAFAAQRGAMLASAAATGIVTAAQWLWNAALTANPIGLVVVAIGLLVGALIYAYTHSETFRQIVDNAFHVVAASGQWLWNNVLQPVFDALVGAFQTTWAAAQSFARIVGDAWDGLRSAAAAPVRFVVNTVFGGVVDAFNAVSGAVGGPKLSRPSVGFSGGGYTGDGGKYEPKGVVHGGEYVINKDSTSKIMSTYPGLLQGLNGYADGGFVGNLISSISGGISAVMDFMKDPAGTIGKVVDSLVGGVGSTALGQMGIGMAHKAASAMIDKVKSLWNSFQSAGGGGGVGAAQDLGGRRVSIGGKMLDATTAGIFQKASAILGGLQLIQGSFSSSVGASAGTHSGAGAMDTWPSNGNWHRAVDVLRSLGAIAWHRTVAQGFSGEHIHSITPGVPGLSPQAAGQVAAFHAGRNGLAGNGPDNNGYWMGGRVPIFDQGGILGRGLNLVNNATGANEHLVPAGMLDGARIEGSVSISGDGSFMTFVDSRIRLADSTKTAARRGGFR